MRGSENKAARRLTPAPLPAFKSGVKFSLLSKPAAHRTPKEKAPFFIERGKKKLTINES